MQRRGKGDGTRARGCDVEVHVLNVCVLRDVWVVRKVDVCEASFKVTEEV